MLALSGIDELFAVTFTVPLVTTALDHVRLVVSVLRVTALPLLSVNFQPDTVVPGGPVTVHVADPALVTDDVQLNCATFSRWVVVRGMSGQLFLISLLCRSTVPEPVAVPTATVCRVLFGSVATFVLLLVQRYVSPVTSSYR